MRLSHGKVADRLPARRAAGIRPIRTFRVPGPAFSVALALGTAFPLSAFVTLDTSQDSSGSESPAVGAEAVIPPEGSTATAASVDPPASLPASAPVDSLSRVPPPNAPAEPQGSPPPAKAKGSNLPHYGTVLYLSARGRETFAVKGFLQALREYGLAPDLLVAEGHAAWPVAHAARDADWALLENQFSEHLLPGEGGGGRRARVERFRGDLSGLDAPQIRISTRGGHWRWENGLEVSHPGDADPEERVLRLSDHLWRLQATPVTLAHCIQARHAATGALGCEGPIPSFHALKASLLTPASAESANPPLNWLPVEGPAGRVPHPEAWGLTYDRLIVLAFDNGVPDAEAKTSVLRVAGDSDLPDSAGLEAWTERGYRTGLRSMDVLRKWLSPHAVTGTAELTAPPVPVVIPFGSREGSVLRHAAETAASKGGLPHPHAPMLRELSLDWAEAPEAPALSEANGRQSGSSQRVLYGTEESYLASAASVRLLFHGERLEGEEPEVFVQSEWCEPFYIPFRLGTGALLGGAQPGYGWHFSLHPLTRLEMALGFFQWRRAWDYGAPTRLWREAGAVAFGMRESHIGLGLFLRPFSRVALGVEVDRIALDPVRLPPEWDDTPYEALRFQGEAALQSEAGSRLIWELRGRWRFWDPVELEGPVRDSLWEQTLTLEVGYRGWELFGLAHTGSLAQREGDWTVPALGAELPGPTVIDGFRMAQSWVAEGWGGGGAYAFDAGPVRVKGTLGMAHTLRGTVPGEDEEDSGFFWEVMATYATRLGPLRAGLGGFENGDPLWAVSLGARADIGAWIARWKDPLSRPLGHPSPGRSNRH